MTPGEALLFWITLAVFLGGAALALAMAILAQRRKKAPPRLLIAMAFLLPVALCCYACATWPSGALGLVREAHDVKDRLRIIAAHRKLTDHDMEHIALCDESAAKASQAAADGWPALSPEAVRARGEMRTDCAGLDGWGEMMPDLGGVHDLHPVLNGADLGHVPDGGNPVSNSHDGGTR